MDQIPAMHVMAGIFLLYVGGEQTLQSGFASQLPLPRGALEARPWYNKININQHKALEPPSPRRAEGGIRGEPGSFS